VAATDGAGPQKYGQAAACTASIKSSATISTIGKHERIPGRVDAELARAANQAFVLEVRPLLNCDDHLGVEEEGGIVRIGSRPTSHSRPCALPSLVPALAEDL
jgi:hypothetical protein